MSFYPKGVSGFALKPCKKLRKGNKRRQTTCRCWLGSPALSPRLLSPSRALFPLVSLAGIYILLFFFPLSTEVRGSCARNALGISTLRSWVNGSSCRGAAEMLARGLLAQLRLSFRCAKRARWDSSSSEAPSEAWWGRTCGGWKAEWEASGAGELRLGSEKKKIKK